MTFVGFKKAVIRVLDEETAQEGKNIFTVKGDKKKGATQTADISGLSSEALKTYGSDGAYHIDTKGVGDVKVNLGLVDLQMAHEHAILGRKKKAGMTVVGNSTEAPLCSLTLFSETPGGEEVAIGFFAGKFIRENYNLETRGEGRKELGKDELIFTAETSSSGELDGEYFGIGVGREEVAKVMEATKINAG